MKLKKMEIEELLNAFNDLLNYDSNDPTEPIDPLTYVDPDGDNCLHIAANRGDHRSAELLLKAGLDVNQIGDMGCTALHLAYMNGHQDIIRLLVDHGASDSIKNEFGKQPSELMEEKEK
jgi:ankyrin repeat protein